MGSGLFNDTDLPAHLPPGAVREGLRYADNLVTEAKERDLVSFIAGLDLRRFEFAGGFLGHRRVKSFGWRYDYATQRLTEADPIPAELGELGRAVADFAGCKPDVFRQVLITEYRPGAGIGWHKDKAMFGDIAGVSLLAPCKFRLRLRTANGWKRASFVAAPRSAYLLSGPARSLWEHSIAPMEQLRYSITFRSFQ